MKTILIRLPQDTDFRRAGPNSFPLSMVHPTYSRAPAGESCNNKTFSSGLRRTYPWRRTYPSLSCPFWPTVAWSLLPASCHVSVILLYLNKESFCNKDIKLVDWVNLLPMTIEQSSCVTPILWALLHLS